MKLKMALFIADILLLQVFCDLIDWSQIPTPPRFIHQPNDPIIYFTVENTQTSNGHNLDYLKERTLRCIADANPSPVYKWRKNGKPFNLAMFSDRIAQRPGEGSFIFSKLTDTDQGVYQCEATNDNGTAISEKIILEKTWIHYFPKAEPEIVRVELGEAYQRNCTPPESNPSARVYWIFKGDEEGSFDSINSSHISTNEMVCTFFLLFFLEISAVSFLHQAMRNDSSDVIL
ncbi:hypothetical protein AB6A40_000149 [Gnathostoma spinigerum]|uniref:Ig-like domain-containing protein n=1 Tax=Gnathostoma spinigerum TaxID=75299 RepID=A0ABD6EAW1_9BILA